MTLVDFVSKSNVPSLKINLNRLFTPKRVHTKRKLISRQLINR